MIRTGLDSLIDGIAALDGRRFGLLSHAAAVAADYVPIQLAVARAEGESPVRLFAPEHGYFGVEQDMVASTDSVDPWIGVPVVSLYGDSLASLRPDPDQFEDLDLLVIDFQDVGSRYYTYAATAVWAAEVALAAGLEVWVLDRPNPLGGCAVEGNIRGEGLESFVGALPTPVRHGLTLAELVTWALSVLGADASGLRAWTMEGWERDMSWRATGRRWIAPSPNMPTPRIARIYPGACLLEATTASEGRGTARPFELFGSPTVSPVDLADRLNGAGLDGSRFAPTYFRPQFQKHAGDLCGGVQWIVEDSVALQPYRNGVEIIRALAELDASFGWRSEVYEFVEDKPAIDLLTGSSLLRKGVESGGAVGDAVIESWLDGWAGDESAFIASTEAFLLYPGLRRGARI